MCQTLVPGKINVGVSWMTMVFVNYRVREQAGYASLLHRELARTFGVDRVFIASRSIRPGDDFREQVFATLRKADVLLAVIGPHWLEFLHDIEEDWVRQEIREAFAAGLRVIPVLVEDAELPEPAALPSDIAALARCQYARMRHYSIETDLAQLVGDLRRTVPALERRLAEPPVTEPVLFRLDTRPSSSCRLAIAPGSIRRVRTADVWVNSENTDMRMARHNDFSISSIVRYWGAVRDEAGRVVTDLVADELDMVGGPLRPVAPGTVVVTGAGMLTATHNVHRILHVAAVHGEPGAGYRQVRNVSWCVTNVLTHAERIADELPSASVLFPLLGVGVAGGEISSTATSMVTAATDYVAEHPGTRLRRVLFLAHTEPERRALENVFESLPLTSEPPVT